MVSASAPFVDPCVCPLCGQPNRCAMANTASDVAPPAVCWCVNASFSPALLARVPAAAQRRACICERCARDDANTQDASHA